MFLALRTRIGDGVFVIGNVLPLAFGALFGMRWGAAYAVVHAAFGLTLAGLTGFASDRLVSNGVPAIIITTLLSAGLGRIRDLTVKLEEHRAQLEALVEMRTADLDMIMEPGISGLETYRRIAQIRPGQKALIASGFSESQAVKQVQALGAGAYLRKPYTLEALAVAVKQELKESV